MDISNWLYVIVFWGRSIYGGTSKSSIHMGFFVPYKSSSVFFFWGGGTPCPPWYSELETSRFSRLDESASRPDQSRIRRPLVRSRFQARIIMPPTLLSTTQLAPFFRACAARRTQLQVIFIKPFVFSNGLRKVCLNHYKQLPDDWLIDKHCNITSISTHINHEPGIYAKPDQPII